MGNGVSEVLRAKFGFSGILSFEKQLTPVTTEGKVREEGE